MQKLRTSCHRIILILAAVCLSTSVTAHPGSGIAVDRLGQVYFLDTGSGLWKIDGHGKLARISETRFHWLAPDADDRFAHAPLPSGSNGGITKAAAKPTPLLPTAHPLTIAQDRNIS